jgi:threonine synthase
VLGYPVENPETVATAIRIGNPASWGTAVTAASESGGEILAVSDEQIMSAYVRVAREGLFAEPASAAGVAGLLELAGAGRLDGGATVVCVLTGHGLKDPDAVMTVAQRPPVVPDDGDAVARELGL